MEVVVIGFRDRHVAVHPMQDFPFHSFELVGINTVSQLHDGVPFVFGEPFPNLMLDIVQTHQDFCFGEFPNQRYIGCHVNGFDMDDVEIFLFECFAQFRRHVFAIKPANLVGIARK